MTEKELAERYGFDYREPEVVFDECGQLLCADHPYFQMWCDVLRLANGLPLADLEPI